MVEEKSSDGSQNSALSLRVRVWLFRAALALIVVLVFRPIIIQEGLVPLVFGLMMLNAVIVVHELGHLIAARRVGVAAEVFSIGLGPTLLSKRWRGIEWRLSAIPCGGFVELGECARERQRFIIAAAGPLASLFFGFLSMLVAGMFGGVSRKVVSPLTVAQTSRIARAAGLRPGDVLTSIDGVEVNDRLILDLRQPRGANGIKSSVSVVVHREGKRVLLDVPIEHGANAPRLGVTFKESFVWLSLKDSSVLASRVTGALAAQPVALPAMLVAEPKAVADSITGPGGVLQLASGAYSRVPAYWLFMVGLLSGAIGGFQLLPLVPLDGGRMAEAVLRWILRNAGAGVRVGVITAYSVSTFLCLLSLVVIGLTRDIFR